MKRDYSRNIPLLYVYSVLMKRVTIPIITLYYLSYHLTYTQIGILAAVTGLTCMATNMHLGVFADLHGKRWALALQGLFGGASMLFLYFGEGFFPYLFAGICYGIAGGFLLGARETLLYDSLVEMKQTSQFKQYYGRMVLYSHIINALLLIAIPVLYVYDTKLPFLIAIVMFAVSVIVALLLVEPPLTKHSKISFSTYNEKIMETFRVIRGNKKLFSLLLLSTVLGAFATSGADYYQPLLKAAGLPVALFGLVYFGMRIVRGIGAEITYRLEKYLTTYKLVLLCLAMLLASFVGLAWGVLALVVFGMIFSQMEDGMSKIVLTDEISKSVRTNRTTLLSVASLTESLLNAFLGFVFGVLADNVGVQAMFGYALVLFCVCVIGMGFVRKIRPTAH